jgi:hypothetical protein
MRRSLNAMVICAATLSGIPTTARADDDAKAAASIRRSAESIRDSAETQRAAEEANSRGDHKAALDMLRDWSEREADRLDEDAADLDYGGE